MTIHKEGFLTITLAALVLVLLNVLFHVTLSDFSWLVHLLLVMSIAFFSLIVYFFRLPNLHIEKDDNVVLSPADGTVVAIEEMHDNEYFSDPRIQVSVFMSPLNVHVNRYPISGEIKYFKHHNGHFHVAWNPKSSTENEHTSTVVRHKSGTDILFKQIAGALARRIVSYARVSAEINQGDQCGFIKFGSRVDVLLPLGTKINVELEQKVHGGKTVLATL
jgi:phosphatidylserine decarboxylase